MPNSIKKTSLSKKRAVTSSDEVDLDLLGALQFWWSRKIEYLVFTLLIILVAGSLLFIGQKLTNNSHKSFFNV